MSNFWPEKWSRSLKKFELWSFTRELLKQYLTEKKKGCLRSGHLREVVAYRSGRYEKVDCNCQNTCQAGKLTRVDRNQPFEEFSQTFVSRIIRKPIFRPYNACDS